MTINVSIQYDGGLLPDIILLTQCYLHRGTYLNTIKKLCICSLCSHLKQYIGEMDSRFRNGPISTYIPSN